MCKKKLSLNIKKCSINKLYNLRKNFSKLYKKLYIRSD